MSTGKYKLKAFAGFLCLAGLSLYSYPAEFEVVDRLVVDGYSLFKTSASVTGTGISGASPILEVGGTRLKVTADGNVGVSTGIPQGRLDIVAAGSANTDMVQLWRRSDGTIVSSMSATGVMKAVKFEGDGFGLTNISATSALDLFGGTTGAIPYQNAANDTVFLSAGPVGYLLQANGPLTAPTWTNAPAMGGGNITNIPWANVLKAGSSLAHLETRSAADLSTGILPLARLSGITNTEISASAGIVDTKLATIATAGKVSNAATTAASANTASAIVARDAGGNFTAGTITAATFSGALSGNAATATTATTAAGLAGGLPNQVPYQSAANTTSFLAAPGANVVLYGNSATPVWTNTPTLTGTNITGVPWAGVLKAGSSLADLATKSAADLDSGILPLARLSAITNTEISASAAIVDTKLATIATSGKVSNSATTAASANTAGAIVARDAGGSFTAGTITASSFSGPLAGNAATATTATNLAGGGAYQLPYQSAANTTTFLAAPGANVVLYGNSATPVWTNTPALTGTNIIGVPWAGVLKTGSSLADLATRSAADLDSGILPLARLSGITNNEISASAGIVDTKLATIATAGKVSNSATTAASANTASAIVARDASGNFTAGTITAAGIYNGGMLYQNTIAGQGSGAHGISWYSPAYYTWFNYMSQGGGAYAPSGAAAPTDATSGVTSWALRSNIENTANFGWIFESGANTSGAAPTVKFSINANNGNIHAAGSATIDGSVTATTFNGALSGNAGTATNLAGGLAYQVPYQTGPNVTTFVAVPGANVVLFSNAGAPSWTNTPALTGTNITGVPWAGVLKAGSTLADLETKSAADLTSGILPLARLSGITNAEIAAAAGIVDTKLATIATSGKVSNSATTAANLNTASAIVARDGSGNFSAGTITAALIGNVTGNASGTAGSVSWTGVTTKPLWMQATLLTGTMPSANKSMPSGFYEGNDGTNYPTMGTWYNLINSRHQSTSDDHGFQIAASYYDENVWTRTYKGGTGNNDGTYTGWKKLVREEPGTSWGISITGNAATATTATNLAGGLANQLAYQSGPGATTFVEAPGANSVLFSNAGAPAWTNTPALTGTNITGIPWAGVLKTGSSLADLATRSAADLSTGILPLARLSGITNAEISASAGIVDTKLATIATANKVSNSATTAASANTASAIVARDGSGNFTAGAITANYVNTTDDVNAGNITYLMAKFGDNNYRSATAAKTAAFIGATNIFPSKTVVNSGTLFSGNWYRIAVNGTPDTKNNGDRAMARFSVYDAVSVLNNSATVFYAGYHLGANPTLTLLNRSWYSASGVIGKVRLLSGGTTEGAILEVYCANTGTAYFVMEANDETSGWTTQPFTASSIPAGFTATTLNLDTKDPVFASAANGNADQFYVDRLGNLKAGTVTASAVTAATFTGALAGNANTATSLAGGAAGSLPYQSAANTTAMLAPSPNYVLKSGAAQPSWSTLLYDNGTNIGIGTNNPTSKLYVNGDIYATGSITGAIMAASLKIQYVDLSRIIPDVSTLEIDQDSGLTLSTGTPAHFARLTYTSHWKREFINGADVGLTPTGEETMNNIAGNDITIVGDPNSTPTKPKSMTWSLNDNIDLTSIKATGAGGLSLTDNASNLGVFIKAGGNVGIGAAAANDKLDVAGFTRTYGLRTSVLTTGGEMVYIKGTGANNNANRVVKIGNSTHVDGSGRGLTLTILTAATHALVGSTNYDTHGDVNAPTSLATALNNLTRAQIGILTSYDAWEADVNDALRTAARRLGLFKLGAYTLGGMRRPYAAIFSGSGIATANTEPGRKAIEVMESDSANAPPAVLAAWLIEDGFTGNNLPSSLVSANSQTVDPALTVNSAGNVGVGTVTPGVKLAVSGTVESLTTPVDNDLTAGGFVMKDQTSGTRWGLHSHGNRLRTTDGTSEFTYITTVDSVGAGNAEVLNAEDNRTIAPNELAAGKLKFGFTSWTNNNSAPYADFLHLRSYTDATGGSDNLAMFRKDTIGLRLWQQAWGSATAYSAYKDIAFTDGTNATGTWPIGITGNAAYAPNASKLYSTDAGYAYGSANPYYGYLTYTGTRWRLNVSPATPAAVEVAYADAAGNADTVDSLHPPQFFNNMGQNHGTQTDFNAVADFGARYVQGATNGPGTGSSQFYGLSLGLGNDYAYSQYALQLAIPRYVSTDKYLSIRNREGGTWQAWSKISAGYADTAGTAGGAPPTGPASGVLSGTYPSPGFANNVSYPVSAADGNGLKFWNGSDSYKISMGSGAEYKYGSVTDYSIKTAMDSNGSTRGFTWGVTGSVPVASLNVGNGNLQVAGAMGVATAPSAPLHVAGAEGDANSVGIFRITSANSHLRMGNNSGYSWIQSHNSKPLYINELGNNVVLNLGGGNVGITTPAPNQKLSVNGGIGFSNQNDADKKLYSPSDGTLQWMTHNAAGTHAFEISHQGSTVYTHLDTTGNTYIGANGGGNVGIGLTDPGTKLEVAGNVTIQGSNGYSLYDWTNSDTNWRIGMGIGTGFNKALATSHTQFMTYSNGAGQGFAVGVNGGNSSFEISGADHGAYFRGKVGIGMTPSTQQLEVAGNIKTSGVLMGQGGTYLTHLPWFNIGASFTGYLKLVTPIVANESNMFEITIKGYEYGNGGQVSTILCGGYAYGAGGLIATDCNTDGTNLPVEIGTENRGGTNYVVIRLGTPSWGNWYYSHFTAEYVGWAAKDPATFTWVKAETTPAQTGNTNNVFTDDSAGTITTTGNVGIGTAFLNAKLNFQGDALTTLVSATRSDNTQPGTLSFDGWGNYAFNKALAVGSAVALNGTTAMLYVNGNVGIGTTGPGEKLDITGGNLRVNPAGGGQVWIGRTHAEGGEILFKDSGNNNAGWIQGLTANTIRFVDPGWTKTTFSVDNNGNGYFAGALTAVGLIRSNANGTAYFCGGDDACIYDVNVANTVAVEGTSNSAIGSLQLGSAGGIISGYNSNIGIGTTGPGYKLDVQGTGRFAGQLFASQDGQAGGYTTADLVLGRNDTDKRGYGQTGGSTIMLRSAAKSSITALDENQNLGQISYENLIWTIGENIGWGVQTVYVPGSVGIGLTNPGARLQIADAYPAIFGTDGLLKIKSLPGPCCGTESVSLQTSIDGRTDDYTISGYGGDNRHVLALQPQGGYVGIGTLLPGYKLDVVGNMRVASGDNSYIYYGPNASWGGYLYTGATANKAGAATAQVISTNGNLHLDSGSSNDIYLNYYSAGRPIHLNGPTDSGYTITAAAFSGGILPMSTGAAGVKTGRSVWANGLYNYQTYGDPNAPTTYGAIVGYGAGTSGTGELYQEWTDPGRLYHRWLRDCCQNWSGWVRILDTNNDPYPSNMNQYVRTTDAVNFGSIGIGTAAQAQQRRLHITSLTDRGSNGIFQSDGDGRAGIVVRDQYPLIDIVSNIYSNTNHGATLGLVAYNGDGSQWGRWVMGTSGVKGGMLSIGYAENNSNPHYGIGWGWGGDSYTKLTLDTAGNLNVRWGNISAAGSISESSAYSKPIYTTTLYGGNGDVPFRTYYNSPRTMRYVYGPFSYAMPGCPAGMVRNHKLYAEFVDNITTGGQLVYLRIAFSDGKNDDFNMGYTWGGSPSFRTYLSGPFTETDGNHASIQLWVSGGNGPYAELRKAEIRTYCTN